jgi:hypothetical protein
MADWGLCTTVKAPTDQVLAFVAHHLAIGARQIWLFFDDPDDPAYEVARAIPGVIATRCDAAYWQTVSKSRPETHQNRQVRNVHALYGQGLVPWLGHIDVDEFLWPARPIAEIFDALPENRIMLRAAPWEALHDPALPDDIFTARQFRAALKRGPAGRAARMRAFGPYARLLPSGALSHAAGKCFFRRGVRHLAPRLHTAHLNGERVTGEALHLDVALLHFHAQDPVGWKAHLHYRLTRGAYRAQPALIAALLDAPQAAIDAFYATVQCPDAATRRYLAENGLLIEVDLGLRAKVAHLLATLS